MLQVYLTFQAGPNEIRLGGKPFGLKSLEEGSTGGFSRRREPQEDHD